MTLPMSTTKITVLKSAQAASSTVEDPWEAGSGGAATPGDSYTAEATGIAAHISNPTGFERNAGGAQESVTFDFYADLCDMNNLDRVLDERTGDVYEVVYVRQRYGFGLEHMQGQLRQVSGAV